jgi:putative ABC transport system permease protein
MLIVLYTKDEVSFDRFHEKKDQIFRVTATMTNENGSSRVGSTNVVVGPSFAEEIPEVAAYVRMETTPYILRRGTDTFNKEILSVDPDFFNVFSFPLIAGDPQRVLSRLNDMVLTEESAVKYFGTTDVVGKTLELQFNDKFETFVVTGVAKNPPQNSSIQFDIIIPFLFARQQYTDTSWIGFYIHTYMMLRSDADYKAVEPKLDQVFLSKAGEELKSMKERFDFKDKIHFGLQPFQQIHLDTEFGDIRNGLTYGSNPIYSYILSGIALFILIIACINFINLTIAHSLKRVKEIGLRKVIGGQRSQLIGQFLGESFILCFIAFGAAILIVQLALPYFNELANKRLDFSYLIDIKLIAGYVILFLVTGLVSGFYPAVVLSGFSPVRTLYNRFQGVGKNYLAKGLVILQFALATFLIIATVGIYAQFNFLTHTNLGYNDENLLIVHLGRGGHDAEISALKNELADESSIEITATKDFGQSWTVAKVNNEEKEIGFAISWIDENFLSAIQVPIIQGRNFSLESAVDGKQSVIVNESFVNEAGWGSSSGNDPIGQIINYADQQLVVVGVAKDYHFRSLKEKIGPLLFKKGSGDLWVKIKPGQAPHALKTIQNAYKRIIPFRPFDYDFMNTINEQNYEAEEKWKQMITVGAALSIFIAGMGMFALMMLSVQRRGKEIGIRKVLGAAVSNIVVLLSMDFLKLVLIAFLLAIPVGYYAMQQWLEGFAYRIHLEWWYFIGAGLMAMMVAWSTIGLQTVNAARVNPTQYLKDE